MTQRRSALCPLFALGLLGAGIQFLVVPIDADVSWLITVSERVLEGQRLYVDIFEVNPPASVWLYLPQVALAHALGIRPETLIVILTTLAAMLSSAVTERLCRTQQAAPAPFFVILAVGFVTLILPGGLYAQREHYALLLMLPVAAVMARLAEGRRPPSSALLVSGAAAGAIVIIKPFFLFAVLFPAVYAAVRGRTWKPLFLAAGGAVVVMSAYAVAVVIAASEYLAAVPMLAEVYGPMRERTLPLILGASVLVPIVTIALAWVLRPTLLSPFQSVLALSIIGFTIAVLIQGKGYWNHALPGLGLGVIMIGWSVLAPHQAKARARAGAVALAVIGAVLVYATLSIQPPRGLVAALKATAPANPTMITLGTEFATGHPAVRLVDGRWVGSRGSLYTAAGVRYGTANRTRNLTPNMERWYRQDIDGLAGEIRRHRPDVVLVEDKPLPWLAREPAIAAAMRDYRPAARAGNIAIWIRKPDR